LLLASSDASRQPRIGRIKQGCAPIAVILRPGQSGATIAARGNSATGAELSVLSGNPPRHKARTGVRAFLDFMTAEIKTVRQVLSGSATVE
jgi:hypothetical protein